MAAIPCRSRSLIIVAVLATSPAFFGSRSEAAAATARAADEGGVQSKFRVGGDFVGTFPIGQTSEVGTPSLGVQGSAIYYLQNGIGIGVIGGRTVMTFRTTRQLEGTLTETEAGATVRYEFLRWPWHTRPFVALDAGYAQLQGSNLSFDPPTMATSSNGLFFTPKVGLRGIVGKRIGFEATFLYHHIRSQKELATGDLRLNNLAGMGLSFGLFVAF